MKEERNSKREGVTHGLSKYLHALGACTDSSKNHFIFPATTATPITHDNTQLTLKSQRTTACHYLHNYSSQALLRSPNSSFL